MAGEIPTFSAPPAGLKELAATVFSGATQLDVIRAAKACRSEMMHTRRDIRRGKVPISRLDHAEGRIVSLMVMEGCLTMLCGALRSLEGAAEELPGNPGELPASFVSVGDAVGRVVAAMPRPSEVLIDPIGEHLAEVTP